jgi:hypothetical protein
MLYAVLFTDNEAQADVRPRLMPAHLEFLEKNRRQVRAAGPLLDQAGKGAGGLWLVDADGPEAVMALVQADPFWPTGLRKDVRVLQWKQVFARSDARAGGSAF